MPVEFELSNIFTRKMDSTSDHQPHSRGAGYFRKQRQRFGAIIGLFALTFGTVVAKPAISETKPDGTPNKAVWMAKGGYGIMVHYLVRPQGATAEEKTADLNRIVNGFDLPHFMNQFDESGADWLIFTLAQSTGYLSSRNEFIDAIQKGYSPDRDLVSEIGTELHKRGKKMIVYLPGAHTPADPTIKRLLKMGSPGYTDRHNEFIRHYSLKLGKLNHGWWFDSCAPQENKTWLNEIEACRAGNPDSVVAFSGAEFCASKGNISPLSPVEDYHAGEIHLLENGRIRTDLINPNGNEVIVTAEGKLREKGKAAGLYLPDSQFIGNVQLHCLLPIDLSFNPAIPNQYCHYTDKELFRFVDSIKSVGGAITINVPITGADGPAASLQPDGSPDENGHIPQDTHAQLVRLHHHLKAIR